MKIAISATGPSLDSEIDPRFGRSQYFIVVESDTMRFETLRNPDPGASSGAGISTAQLICNQGGGAVLTGRIGPKAHQVLSAGGVRMLTGVGGKVRDAIERFKSSNPMDMADSGAAPDPRAGSGMGRGKGMGAGRGRGMGRGGGKGMGMGAGRAGAGGGSAPRDWDSEPWLKRVDQLDSPESLDNMALLKQQAQALDEERGKIRLRIEEMEKEAHRGLT